MDGTKHILSGLERIAAWMRTAEWRSASERQLTPTQQRILEALDTRGTQTVGKLADDLGVTQPTLSDAARALEAKELIARSPSPDDRRVTLLEINRKGQRLAQLGHGNGALANAVAALPDADRTGLMRGVTGLIRHLQIAGEIPVQRMCVTCTHFRPNLHSDSANPHHCAFVGAAFGDASLRVDCGEHEQADAETERTAWSAFSARAAT